MHEVSVASNILKIVNEELENNNGEEVNQIHLAVGALSGIVVESLRFALDVSRNETLLKNTEILIDEIPANVQCRSCNHEFTAEDYYVICPHCQGIELDFLSGRELLIKSIVIS
jgi:hydrogenase nickel incorporation protein HypA/HybF